MTPNVVDRIEADTISAGEALSEAPRPLECGSHSGPRWYVVQTHRGSERLAVDELSKQDFATLLPLRRIEPQPVDPSAPRRHRKREHLPRLAVAFPGYLFVLFDRRTQPWRAIHGTRGVKRLFSSSPETPVAIPVGVVERLMAGMSRNIAMALPADAAEDVPEGTIVTVLDGPFERKEAVCIRSELRSGCIRVQMLESGWPAELPRESVAVVE